MKKCKSILCSNPAVIGYDFCGECIDRYVLAMLQGQMNAAADDDHEDDYECNGQCDGCQFEEGSEEIPVHLKYPQYYKDVSGFDVIDVYAVHGLFGVGDATGAIQHASKKLLLSGVRTGGKSMYQDIKEARDTLNRWLDLYSEE
jgi:hypothetical protein